MTPGNCFREYEKKMQTEKQLATIMNSFFINITKGLQLKKDNESKR